MSELATRDLILPAPECATDDATFGDGLPMRIYGDGAPAVVIVSGYRDAGFEAHVGCRFLEMQSVKTWARHFAAAGARAITYGNREPVDDLVTLLETLAVEDVRLFAVSGHVPTALAMLPRVRRAALCYGYLLGAEEEAAAFRFAYPLAGKTIDDVASDAELMLVRAGGDQMPRLNASIDAFVHDALQRDLPLTLVNVPGAPHAFDLTHDTPRSLAAIEAVIRFLTAP